MGRASVVAALAAAMLASPRARADDRSKEAARLFDVGRSLVQKGNYAEGCKVFETSLELEDAPGTQLNVADCRERDGKLVEAWRLFGIAVAAYEAQNKPNSVTFATKRQTAVAAKLVTLNITFADKVLPAGLALDVAGVPFDPDDSATVALPGAVIVVRITARGIAPFTKTLDGAAGETIQVRVPHLHAPEDGEYGRLPGDPPPDLSKPREQPHHDGPRRASRVHLALGVGVGAIVLGAAGGTFAYLAKSQYDEAIAQCPARRCPTSALQDRIDSSGTRADIASVLAISAGVAAVTAIVLYATAPRDPIYVAPTATADSIGVDFITRF